jgi:site-specific recombinase XerD
MAQKGIDERIIKKIVGHKGQGVTQVVYTHFEMQQLLESINLI